MAEPIPCGNRFGAVVPTTLCPRSGISTVSESLQESGESPFLIRRMKMAN